MMCVDYILSVCLDLIYFVSYQEYGYIYVCKFRSCIYGLITLNLCYFFTDMTSL